MHARLLAILFTLVMAISSASAFLGASERKCMTVYGQPTDRGVTEKGIHWISYRWKKMDVDAYFKDGEVFAISYFPYDEDKVAMLQKLNDDQNAWRKVSEGKWTTKETTAEAVEETVGRTLLWFEIVGGDKVRGES